MLEEETMKSTFALSIPALSILCGGALLVVGVTAAGAPLLRMTDAGALALASK